MAQTYLHLPDLITPCPFTQGANSHFERASAESVKWVDGYNIFPKTDSKRAYLIMSNGSLLASYVYPSASYEDFRVCCDFMNWLFHLDNISDGMMRKGTEELADTVMNALWFPDRYMPTESPGKEQPEEEVSAGKLARE